MRRRLNVRSRSVCSIRISPIGVVEWFAEEIGLAQSEGGHMATDIRTNQAMSVSEPAPLPLEHWPSVEHLVTEDDTPVDNIFSEKQQRLLTEPLYTSWISDVPFLALANVGLFHSVRVPPYVPDVLFSLNVQLPESLFPKSNRSYFVWEYGKSPDVVIEIVSNREGNEDRDKLIGYARMGIPFYVIYDPEQWLRAEKLRSYELRGGRYEQLPGEAQWMPSIGLGVALWDGDFEGHQDRWLRWTDLTGNPIATGAERAGLEQQRADAEMQRADVEMQRADVEMQRADVEMRRADAEQQRADAERQRAEILSQQLKRLGIEPQDLPR